MRYSEGNLNRLQIAGELHVKSGKVLDKKDIPELSTPLELEMLYDEASGENRGQMARTSAEDFVQAVLLDVHHAMYLVEHPRVRGSLAQDQLMALGVETLERRAPKVLRRLRKEASQSNLEASNGRMRTDWIEPELLFWSAWHHRPLGEQADKKKYLSRRPVWSVADTPAAMALRQKRLTPFRRVDLIDRQIPVIRRELPAA